MGNYHNATVKQEQVKVFRWRRGIEGLTGRRNIANSKYYTKTIKRFIILGPYPKVMYNNMWRDVECRNGSWELSLCD